MARILARIDSARAAGLDVKADQYPYTRAATALDASIPSWAESGGWDSLLARLRDPATRARLRDEMLNPRGAESFYYEAGGGPRSEEHTSELQARPHLVCRLLP